MYVIVNPEIHLTNIDQKWLRMAVSFRILTEVSMRVICAQRDAYTTLYVLDGKSDYEKPGFLPMRKQRRS